MYVGCISNALCVWLCMCMAEDCLGCALDLYRFLIIFGVYMGCISNDLDWLLCMCMAEGCIGCAFDLYM